jgi:hypothetical protein
VDGLPVFIRTMIKFEGYGLVTDCTQNRFLEDVHVSPRWPECYRVSYNTYASRRLPRITLTLADGYPGELFNIEHCCRNIFSAWEDPAGGAL